jgi:hypothetical protein
VGTVLSCVAQRETPHLLLASIANGCGYTDIAPMWMHKYPPTAAMEAEAVKTGARIIFGAGLVPGISSILARMGADRVGPVDSVASTCLLSAGNEYGLNSRDNLREEFGSPFETTINSEKVLVWPFTRPQRVSFAPPIGPLTAYLIPFTDQLYYPKTLGARTAIARLAFLPQWPLPLLSVILPLAGRSLGKRRSGRQGVAQSALAFLHALTEGEVGQAGIWGEEQIVPVDPFLKRLAVHGLIPTIKMIEPAYSHDDHKSWKKNEGV